MQRLPRSSALGEGSVGSEEILQNNISLVGNGFQSGDLNLSSPKLYVSSLSSLLIGSKENVAQNNISPVATGFQCDFSLSPSKLYVSSLSYNSLIGSKERLQNNISPRVNGCTISRLSVEPQSVAGRHCPRKVQHKIRSLEKLIPLKSKLDTEKMLEEASEFVKFLQAQLHVIELMPSFSSQSNGLNSAGTIRFHSTGNMEEKRGGENLSAVAMLNLLVTSRAVKRELFTEEKCVGTGEQYQMAAIRLQLPLPSA